jgi:integrase
MPRAARSTAGSRRQRGEIETLPSGSLRVKVYAGLDQVTGKKHFLAETVPAGLAAYKKADATRTRFLSQVDERRSPRTRATMNQLLDRWLEALDVEVSTRRGYVMKLNKHIRAPLGDMPAARIGVEELEAFYATLRRCRDRCRGRRFVVHRKVGEHACTAVCRPHVCRGLADTTIRQIHWIISGALDAGVRWGWIPVNSAPRV